MSALYPFKFTPIFKEKLWGGQKIKTILGKDFGKLDNCGETWELSGVSGNISVISNGSLAGVDLQEVLEEYKNQLVGDSIYKRFGNEFPLLIKFIDAAEDLSIQVHPNDDLARRRHKGFGKSEMWYILQSDPGATLIDGFKRDSNRSEYLSYLESGGLDKILNLENVAQTDAFYLPAGRVHNIGKGILLAEIQQTSDLTYRIYDFDRVDKNGKKRELHREMALDAIDYKQPDHVKSVYDNDPNRTNTIVSTPYFTTNKLVVNKTLQLERKLVDCFKVYIGVGGSGRVAGEAIKLGVVVLVPANMKEYTIEPDGELALLETYIEL